VSQPGLRELKREATAKALAVAAFELARARGLDGFVIDDVAERAGYSRRTFANYYSCKEAAVAAVTYHGVEAAQAALADIPPDVPLLDAIQTVLRRQLTADALARMREVMALAEQHPSLAPHLYDVQHRMRLSAEELLRSVAADRYPREYVALLFGAVYGMVSTALEGAVDVRLSAEDTEPGSASSMDFQAFLDLAFKHLRTGF
jgi:AcrR family transcriptional regulator